MLKHQRQTWLEQMADISVKLFTLTHSSQGIVGFKSADRMILLQLSNNFGPAFLVIVDAVESDRLRINEKMITDVERESDS